MKKTPLFLGMLLTAALAAVPVLAEDTESTAATSYVTEQYGGCGNWYGIDSEGDYNYYITGDFYVLPDGTIPSDAQKVLYTITDDSHFEIPEQYLSEGVSISFELISLTQEILDRFEVGEHNFIDTSVGAPALLAVVSHPDKNDNPLASKNAETVSLLCHRIGQDDYVEKIIRGKSFTVGDHTLDISDDLKISLDNGASTGSIYVSYNPNKGLPVYLEFSWDQAGRITYFPIQITENSITLQNIDDPGEVQLFTLAGESTAAPAEEAAEEEPAEETAE